ncbi:MAG: membrane dipeptidase [Flavobacteriaceae bacterium]|nr:membrane dipeptidase [Flavobacteriaceae bacterium]
MSDSELLFTVDGHLDLATNAMTLNRDLTKNIDDIRNVEKALGLTDFQDRGKGTVSIPELRKGNVGLVITTLISRYSSTGEKIEIMGLPGWHSPEQAFANAMAQLEWYRQMERIGEMKAITSREALRVHLSQWNDGAYIEKKPIGYILALEGADSIVNLDYLYSYYEKGLRSIGISHFGPGRYAAGTHSDGSGITKKGEELLNEMNSLSIFLDMTHLTDKGFYQALDIYDGKIISSHQNCRSLVGGERQFTDDQIKRIIERGGIVGGALDAWMLHPNFKMNQDSPKEMGIGLEKLVDHFDHICQLSGNCRHIGFGSDLDGLFGLEQTPYDMNSIADLQKFQFILKSRGYSDEDIENIFFKNWLNVIYDILD